MKWLIGIILAIFLTTSTVAVAPVSEAAVVVVQKHHHHNHGKHKGQYKHHKYPAFYNFYAQALAQRPEPHPRPNRHHSRHGKPQAGRVKPKPHKRHRHHHRIRHHHVASNPPSTQTGQNTKKCATVVPPKIRTVYKTVPKTEIDKVLYGTGIIAWVAGLFALLALALGYFIGWIRRKRSEEKFLGSLLDKDK